MNIEYANSIPLREILSKFEFRPVATDDHTLVYNSPFTAGYGRKLLVNTASNQWIDEESRRKGDALLLVRLLLKKQAKPHAMADGLKWLKTNVGYIRIMLPANLPDYSKTDKRISVRTAEHLSSGFLISYIEETRKIPFETARFLLKEVTYNVSGGNRDLKAVGVINEDGGTAIRSPYIKAHTTPQNISFIRGKGNKPDTLHIFKDAFDYLSACTKAKGQLPAGDVIILNSLQCIKQSDAYISKYGYRQVCTWMDNTAHGYEATSAYRRFLRSEPGLKHIQMNSLYASHKDVNEWLIATTS